MRRGARWAPPLIAVAAVLSSCSTSGGSAPTGSSTHHDQRTLIAYPRVIKGTAQVWATDPSTGRSKYVAPGTLQGWSPDGRSLLVLSDRLSAVSPTGGVARAIPQTDDATGSAAWSPDGNWIAYEDDLATHSKSTGDPIGLNLIHPDGSGRVLLSRSKHYLDAELSWSTDSKQLVVTTGDDGLWTIAVDGTSTQRLTPRPVNVLPVQPNLPSREDFSATWAPTADRIVFVRYTQSHGKESNAIFTVDPAGHHLRRLTPVGLNAGLPEWSPDSQIAFVGSRSFSAKGGTTAIFVVPADGGQPHPVTPYRSAVSWPTWSADGSEIGYVGTISTDPAPATAQQWGVYVTATAGGVQRNVAVTAPPESTSIAFLAATKLI